MTTYPKKTLLVIEDEPALRRLLHAILEPAGYRMLEATSVREGVALAASHQPDVVVLDLGLPDQDGIQVVKQLREWSFVPILVLSARGQENDKVQALDAGADDYLTKPFAPVELLARLRVALRHAASASVFNRESIFARGPLCVDFAKRQVFLNEHEVHLTPIEYKILCCLVRYRGRVVTYQQLLKEVWGTQTTSTRDHVRVHMFQLRHKLEDRTVDPRWILTETGIGYRFREEPEGENGNQLISQTT